MRFSKKKRQNKNLPGVKTRFIPMTGIATPAFYKRPVFPKPVRNPSRPFETFCSCLPFIFATRRYVEFHFSLYHYGEKKKTFKKIKHSKVLKSSNID